MRMSGHALIALVAKKDGVPKSVTLLIKFHEIHALFVEKRSYRTLSPPHPDRIIQSEVPVGGKMIPISVTLEQTWSLMPGGGPLVAIPALTRLRPGGNRMMHAR